MNLYENGTRLYSDLEVNELINEISEAALEAIEQAAVRPLKRRYWQALNERRRH